ncbi:MAG: glycosyltransferase family 1 protein [Gammaproteobacteria bacterium]
MLRDIGNQLDAPGILVLNLMDNILALDTENEYVLFFKNKHFFDRYDDHPNVKARLLPFPSKLLWDQVLIPWAAAREDVDVIFNLKFSIPLFTKRKTLMHLRGADAWTFPDWFERLEGIYLRQSIPLFCKKAHHLVVESLSVRAELENYIGLPRQKVSLAYLAAGEQFRLKTDRTRLDEISSKYGLPERFLLTVTRVVQGRKFYPGKNIYNLVEAFRQSQTRREMPLVIVGRETREFIDNFLDKNDSLRQDLIVPGAISQAELPYIYTLAEMFVFPSLYESFGIPILEAMACGCPVITSNTYSCPEVAGDAAILVDPENTTDIANAIDRLSSNQTLREEKRRRGLARAATFTWRKSAEQTLKILQMVCSDPS